MTSSVFYKFKSQREPSRVEFDGTGISVFELKRDIIVKSGLGDGADFDLAIFNEDGSEEYDDDTAVIPRSTTVIARRLPAVKRGAGRAQRYMTGKMPVNAKNSSRKENPNKSALKSATTGSMVQMNSTMTEEQRLAAMFEASSQQWSDQLEEMAKQTKVQHSGGKKASDSEPPAGYVCYRCGEKGHWIKECPTNDDPNFENKPRIKRTTGIPRSFLRTVEMPTANSGDGDEVKQPSGIMINAEGQFVIAEPDKKSWEQFQAKTKSSAAAEKAAAMGDKELQDRGLECSIDKRIFIDPMKTPCCEKTYCNDCITNSLIESDFTCPGCQTDGVLLDDLKHDEEMSVQITAYLTAKNAAAKCEKERSKSPSVKPDMLPPAVEAEAKSLSPPPKSTGREKSSSRSPPMSKSTPPVNAFARETSNLKRPADELLENPKIPKGPKAMQQEAQKQSTLLQQQQQQQQQQQYMINGIHHFPSMPFQHMPLYGMPPMSSMPTMNGGFGGMPSMAMTGMSPMMMNGFGFPNMFAGPTAGFPTMADLPMMSGAHMGGHGVVGVGVGLAGSTAAVGFPNQQKTIFAEPLPNEEDNAYFRKPVNPNRHQGRQRRARPQDYREL